MNKEPGLNHTGHYVPAVVHDGVVYVSGTLPSNKQATEDEPFAKQMALLIGSIDGILKTYGSSAANVLSLTLYLTDLNDWDEADSILADYFGNHFPARTVINVPSIRKGFRVQSTLIATTKAS
ncbi:RidA family protein [Salmonella enterica]|uniref:RidA family protein n=1 Tax=Salmonella enterica TaxID=28901 RepID=A0A628V7G6_SALER|nr:hypothetical protein [Salmonella enterica]EEC6702113.1 RidA family protein [Salmonella enterica]ELF5201578.1 RidA family protein [Salmonella enterica]